MDPKIAELRSALEALRWTQSQGAAYCATTEATFSRWLSGKSPVADIALRLLRMRLGRPIDRPYDPNTPMAFRDAPRDPQYLAVWEEDALMVLSRIAPDARSQLIGALRSIVAAGDLRRSRRREATAITPAADTMENVVSSLNATPTAPGPSASPVPAKPGPPSSASPEEPPPDPPSVKYRQGRKIQRS